MSAPTLPELGPLLGKLIAPPGEKAPVEAALDGVRLDLLTAVFERAGTARRLLQSGDASGARAALGSAAWLAAWNQAVAEATRIALDEIDRRFQSAALSSRYPAKRLAAVLPDAEARRVLSARLSATGIPLEDAATRLEDPAYDWQETLRLVSGELESAWERLLLAVRRELAPWDQRAASIAGWRRPWRPLLLSTALALAAAIWLGLVLGGYLPAPGWLRPVTDWLWNL